MLDSKHCYYTTRGTEVANVGILQGIAAYKDETHFAISLWCLDSAYCVK